MDGEPIEGSFRAHQIPIPVDQNDMQHADKLVEWLESYKPDELFDENGTLKSDIAAITPKGQSRMAMNQSLMVGLIQNLLNYQTTRITL